ncbi:MAG: hypothetical protein M1816_007412 [Peltula sp. TS41687]|nr:MAG: hypothetical protein M1816_007412 [Peltula sp. TS41687]
MPSLDRSEGRNVHFFDASRPDEALGGLLVTESTAVTHAVFLSMLHILIVASAPYEVVLRNSGDIIQRTNDPLREGSYDIKSQGTIELSAERVLIRAVSRTVSGRVTTFRDEIRARDGRCVITREQNRNIGRGSWHSFHAAHIFPLAYETEFIARGCSRWINDRRDGETGINSCQNGILLSSGVHELFDSYLVSVDPDHDDLLIFFQEPNNPNLQGNRLHPICRQPGDDRAVPDQLLRWHFRQAVLMNMRGAGEPLLEHDFPPGTDMMGEIRSGPRAAERMEYELFSRLSEQVGVPV